MHRWRSGVVVLALALSAASGPAFAAPDPGPPPPSAGLGADKPEVVTGIEQDGGVTLPIGGGQVAEVTGGRGALAPALLAVALLRGQRRGAA